MLVQLTRILPTIVFGESVKLTFSETANSHVITAEFMRAVSQRQTIAHQNLPENIRAINSSLNFNTLLENQYARIETSGGAPILFLEPKTEQLKDLLFANEIMINIGIGKEDMNKSIIRDNAILLFGKTGGGKSLLGNLLANRPLVAIKRRLKYLFEAENPIFPVSHSNVESCTGCPNLHSPDTNNDTYVDFPGFDDTRGACQDITNAFFRAEVMKKVQRMKSILVIPYNDISARNREILDTFNELFQFFGYTNQMNQASLEMLARSFSFVITKVPAGNDSTHEEIREDILTYLKEYTQAGSPLAANIKTFLSTIINESRWDYFCEPSAAGVSQRAVTDKERIVNLIDNNLVYLGKENSPIQIKVNPRHIVDVQRALLAIIDKVKSSLLGSKIGDSVISTLNAKYREGEEALRNCVASLQALASTSQNLSLTETLQLGQSFFSAELFSEARNFDEVFDFLYNLLPEDIAKTIPIKRNWMGELNCRDILGNFLNLLNNILSPASILSTDGRLILRGHFPKISQISSIIGNYPFNEIEIHALHTLTFDNDLHLIGKDLSVIAHTWKIPHGHQINLSGNDAPPINGSAADGHGLGGNGAHGVPGLPGGNGGSFYGLGNLFEGLNNLSLNANGGRGGRGQNGGNGQPGANGTDAEVIQTFADINISNVPRLPFGGPMNDPYLQAHIRNLNIYMNRSVTSTDRWDHLGDLCDQGNKRYDRRLTKYGRPGGVGGNGGMGGIGGLGGYSGIVNFVSISNRDITFNASTANGANGDQGSAGEGKEGGKRGRDWTGVWHCGGNPDWGWNGHAECQPQYVDSGIRANSGDTPAQKNDAGRANPAPQQQLDVGVRLQRYRDFLNTQKDAITTEFLDDFNNLIK